MGIVMRIAYFDNAASTQTDERVIREMLPYFSEKYGNPSSLHFKGSEAHEDLEKARLSIASAIHAAPDEIIFTSGGTESNNLALKGFAFANRHRGAHIIVSSIEHDCIINSCRWLESQGFRVTYLPVRPNGIVDMNVFADAIRPDTIFVSVMHANNEIGVIEPVSDIGNICRERGICFHTDACQSFGKIPCDVRSMNADMASINGHKIHGPKGIGALFIRKGIRISPLQHGGGHESGLRSSTENMPGIIGLAKAAQICVDELPLEMKRLKNFQDRVIGELAAKIPSVYLNGDRKIRLPSNVNIGFEGFEGQAPNLLMELDRKGIIVSTGSACSSHGNKQSHVLAAIGRNPLQSIGALRITFGRFTTDEDVEYLLQALPPAVETLNSLWTNRQ
jgi:cysteine desulfurase